MTPGKHEKPDDSPPRRGPAPDLGQTMKSVPPGPRLRPDDLRDPAKTTDALLRWDELAPEELALLEQNPRTAHKLALLRAAEKHLGSGLHASVGECPSPEALYDFGRGPGYRPMSVDLRAEIDQHLEHCKNCELLVESLATAPPAPLVIDSPDEERTRRPFAPFVPTVSRPAIPIAPRARPNRNWIPVAVAATLVVGLGLWAVRSHVEAGLQGLPKDQLLRGQTAGALVSPRGSVLAPSAELAQRFPALQGALGFEFGAVPQANKYRIEITRHSGGAFDAGEVLGGNESATTRVEWTKTLAPGHYTWRGFALVHGLDDELGAHDFEVQQDAELERALLSIANETSETGEQRTLAAVRLLHDKGFYRDARELVRTLPASPERDAYLDSVPGR